MTKRADIKVSLLKELGKIGEITAHLSDLIDDYMALWDTKEQLRKDIKKRGVMVEYDNGGGQVGTKKNECVVELPKISKRMTDLLTFLNIEGIDEGDGDYEV